MSHFPNSAAIDVTTRMSRAALIEAAENWRDTQIAIAAGLIALFVLCLLAIAIRYECFGNRNEDAVSQAAALPRSPQLGHTDVEKQHLTAQSPTQLLDQSTAAERI